MKNSRSIIDERQNQIIELLKGNINKKVEDLAGELAVSPITIRRDLLQLEAKGIVRRLYGGASLAAPLPGEVSCLGDYRVEQQAVAAYAARMVEDGDTIFVNTGRTAILLMKYVIGKSFTVVTNNLLAIQMRREIDPHIQIMLTGGELAGGGDFLVGDFAVNSLCKVTASKCFLGVNGISAEGGLTTSNSQKVIINNTMLERCGGPRIVVTDSSKIGSCVNFFVCPVEKVTCIITDTGASPEEVEKLEARGIQVILVDPV